MTKPCDEEPGKLSRYPGRLHDVPQQGHPKRKGLGNAGVHMKCSIKTLRKHGVKVKTRAHVIVWRRGIG